MLWIIAAGLLIEQKPCAVAYTPNSVLLNPPSKSFLRYAEGRPRYSTCGGVAWFQGSKYLFSVGMETSSVQFYEFEEDAKVLSPVKSFTNQDGLNLSRPENISISNDDTLLAIPNMTSGKLQIFYLAEGGFRETPPAATIQGYKLHGARFSPDGRYLSYVGVGEQSSISTCRLVKNKRGKLSCAVTQTIPNEFEPLRPKSIDFSPDGRFAVIGYCTELSGKIQAKSLGLLATYHRDPQTGIIDPSPISYIEGVASLETVVFYPDASCILATDQVNDRVSGHFFDKETGKLGESWIALQNPEAELSFCHGITVTKDGKYVAVSNYGDDKVTVYKVNKL